MGKNRDTSLPKKRISSKTKIYTAQQHDGLFATVPLADVVTESSDVMRYVMLTSIFVLKENIFFLNEGKRTFLRFFNFVYHDPFLRYVDQ